MDSGIESLDPHRNLGGSAVDLLVGTLALLLAWLILRAARGGS